MDFNRPRWTLLFNEFLKKTHVIPRVHPYTPESPTSDFQTVKWQRLLLPGNVGFFATPTICKEDFFSIQTSEGFHGPSQLAGVGAVQVVRSAGISKENKIQFSNNAVDEQALTTVGIVNL